MNDVSLPPTAASPSLPAAGIWSWLPGLWVLRRYERAWLRHDLVAGLVLTAMLVPSGMAYAEASGLPAITGLYATIVPLLAYAVFGPSRIMVLGPDSALAALIAAAVLGAAGEVSPERAVGRASLLAIMTGGLCVAAGLAKLGFLTDLLSKPVRVGYMNGIALTVLVAQLPKLCGFSTDGAGLGNVGWEFVNGVADGRTKPFALAIGAGCLALILGLRAVRPGVPGVLIAVVLSTLAVTYFGNIGDIAVVGAVPAGFPTPAVPAVALSDVRELFLAASGIALVAFADTSVLSRTFAARHGYRVDPDRELVGLGIANLAGGLFRGFPVSSSSSRTPVAESAGAKTQLTGVVGAVAISALLVFVPAILHDLPVPALAAVVIAAALGLFDLQSVRMFYRRNRPDFVLTVVAFVVVAAFGVLVGVPIAVGVSLLAFVRRAWRPHAAILGRAHGVKGYHDITRYPDAAQVPGLVMFRWDAPLFFANAEQFRRRVLEVVDGTSPPVAWVIIAAEPITDVDTTAAEALTELVSELAALGVALKFAELKDPVKDRLRRYGIEETIGRESFFPTLGVAVKAYLAGHPVSWTDWESRDPVP